MAEYPRLFDPYKRLWRRSVPRGSGGGDGPAENGAAPPDTLQALVRDLAAGGEREALVAFASDGPERWRYRDLAERVARRARWLAGKGVGAGDTVILCGPSRADWIVAFLALLRCGACAVPTDAQFGLGTFAHVLRDSGARLVLAAPSAAKRFAAPCEEAGVEIAPLAGDDAETGGDADFATVEPGDRAILFYTSGTTGAPKGVPLTHRNIAYQLAVLAESRLVTAEDRILLPLPLHHVYPLVIGVLVPLSLRVAIVLPDGFTGTRVLEALRRGGVTLMIGVPRLYEALVGGIADRLRRRGRAAAALYRAVLATLRWLRRRLGWRAGRALLAPLHRRIGPSLRTVVSGGAALKPNTAWTLEALGWRVGTGYGLTETSPLLTISPPGEGRFETAGRPIRGVELRIDRDAGGEDGTGEVMARGPGIFAGYHNLEEKTDEVLTADGWFRTGDLGRIDTDGYLRLGGRQSTLIVTAGGENVQPEEIEEAYEAHPAIAEIAVFEDDGRILGLIVPDPALRRDGDPDEAVRQAVREVSRGLPSYQRLAEFRTSGEAIPRTRLGKPRRHLIEERYRRAGEENGEAGEAAAEPVPLDELSGDDRALLENEAAYAAYRLLGERFTGRRVTPDSDLAVDLDVDSIEWLDLSLEVSERAGITLSEESIAEISTVRDLLARVAEGGGDGNGISVEAALADPEGVLNRDQRHWLQPPGRIARALAGLGAAVNTAIFRGLFRLEVRGSNNVPEDAPFVLAPNHASYLDPFAVAAALGRARLDRLCWAGWTGVLFTSPARRAFARVARVLPIDPLGAAASSLAFCGAALKRGLNLAWFPEGQRSPDGRLRPFRAGIGMVLARRRTPVVPVVIRGAYEAWPPSRRLPRLRPVSVEFLPPVDPAQLAGEGEGKDEAQRIVAALHTRVARALDGNRD